MNNGLFKNVAISAVSAELAAFIFLILSTFFTYKTKDPDMLSGFLGISALIFGAVICGIVSAFIKCSQMTAAGVISPAIYTAFQFITAFLAPNTHASFTEAVIKAASIMIIAFTINKLITSRGEKRRSKRRLRR